MRPSEGHPFHSPKLTVLLATWNGARHLDDQIQSIAAQDWERIDIIASDDGSSDDTRSILQGWSSKWTMGRFDISDGPGRGVTENFRSLVINAPIDSDFYGFCDQDDIWLPEKTRQSVAALTGEPGQPALYCARTLIAGADGTVNAQSPLYKHPPSFSNALVQNIGGGNTMILNQAGFHLLQKAARRTTFVSHDWFTYMIVSGAGGHVVCSPDPHVLYRQHDANVVGSNMGMRARVSRLHQVLLGRFNNWNTINLDALDRCRDFLERPAIEVIDRFALARKGTVWRRVYWLRKSGTYRQTIGGQVSLYIACLLNKI
ncbi:MAG: glycosyltransferase [Alphaproteobacteria bacterium]|nr:glycosyltransferase [Alphaproteobacteria bacterium]